MKTILRICTFPTDKHSGMGLNSYNLAGLKGVKTVYLSPDYGEKLFLIPKNTKINLHKYLLTPYPRGGNLIQKLWHQTKRIYFVTYFFVISLKLFFKNKIDIVHIHSPVHFFIALVGKLLNKKVYITYHGIEFHSIYNNKLLAYIFDKTFDISFSLSPAMLNYKDVIKKNNSNVELIFNSIDRNIYINKKNKRKKQIIAVGRLEEQKGYPYLIKAFKLFFQQNKDYKLIIVGAGQLLNKLKSLCCENNIDDNVIFAGQKTRVELIDLYNESEIFALVSQYEGFPKVLMEAMACGCKIVATKVDAVPYIMGGNYPYLVDYGDSKAISTNISDLKNKKYDFFWKEYESILNRYSLKKHKDFMRKIYLN